MKDARTVVNPNKIVQHLGKPPDEFNKKDLIKFVTENHIQMINFRHVAGDGRLKTLNFVVTSMAHLDRLLSAGERVDGSSLFSYIDSASSDLYLVPRYKTAYVNPFCVAPTMDILCSYYTNEGVPLPSSPEVIDKQKMISKLDMTGRLLGATRLMDMYLKDETMVDKYVDDFMSGRYHFASIED